MKKHRLLKSTLAIGVMVCVAGNSAYCQPDDEVFDRTKNEKSARSAGPQIAYTPEMREQSNIWQQGYMLMQQKKYDELETKALAYRTSGEKFDNGICKLHIFYEGISSLSQTGTEAYGQVEAIRAWTVARPDSITAHIALAKALIGYAWKARGSGYAGSVTEEGWKLFRERLQQARLILRKAKGLAAKCPEWYLTLQVIARGQSWELGTYDGSFNESVRLYPDYTNFYFEKLIFLLPRWQGDYGDGEEFAKQAAKKLGGVKGDVLYARMIWYIDSNRYNDGNFEESEISWERIDRGFTELRAQNPDSLSVKSEWARLACIVGAPEKGLHKTRARELFQQIGDQVDRRVWANTTEFTNLRDWAMKN